MTVLVTGGTGYVGFNVIEALLATGRKAVIYDRGALPAAAQRTIAPFANLLTVVQGDICDVEALARVHERYSIDGVIHCAAMTSGTEREALDPVSVVNANLVGTINVLDAARRAKVRRVVYANSGSVYGETLYRGLPRLYEETSLPVPVTLRTAFPVTKSRPVLGSMTPRRAVVTSCSVMMVFR